MAQTFTEAFDDVAGVEFDLAVGFELEQYEAAEPDPEMEAAFRKLDNHTLRNMAERLGGALGVHTMDAEDGLTEGLLRLYEKDPDAFSQSAENWLRLLNAAQQADPHGAAEAYLRKFEEMSREGRF